MFFRFYNGNASSIRAIMVANCLAPAPAESTEQQNQPSSSNTKEERGNPPSHKDLMSTSSEPDNSQEQEEPEVLHHASSRLQYKFLFSLSLSTFARYLSMINDTNISCITYTHIYTQQIQ